MYLIFFKASKPRPKGSLTTEQISSLQYDFINVFYQNVRGLNSKSDVFYSNVVANEFDVILITESWLSPSVHSSELFDSRYKVIRKDRDPLISGKSRGGGVIMAFNQKLKMHRLDNFEINCRDLEMITCLFKIGKRSVICIVVYFVPGADSNSYVEFYELIENIIINYPDHEILITGDFNFPSVSGKDSTLTFQQFLSFSHLKSVNTILNQNNKTLDLILTDCHIVNLQEDEGLVPKDKHHPPLQFNLKFIKSKCVQNTSQKMQGL